MAFSVDSFCSVIILIGFLNLNIIFPPAAIFFQARFGLDFFEKFSNLILESKQKGGSKKMALRFEMDDIDEKASGEIGKEFVNVGFRNYSDSEGGCKITGSVRSKQEADRIFPILSFFMPEEV